MKCDFEQNEHSSSFATKLGNAATIMMHARSYLFFPIACLRQWLQPPILLDQIRFFFDRRGLPVGYVTWAYLTEEVETRLLNDPKVLFHISEWNEGDRIWIMDFVAPTGFAKPMLTTIRNEMFNTHEEVRSLRRCADGTVRSVTTWRRSKREVA